MRHYKQLWWQNKEYALHVMGAVSSTLSGISAGRSENGPTVYQDPLDPWYLDEASFIL